MNDPTVSAEIAKDLRDLLQSPGWQILTKQVDTEWGPAGYGRRMEEAIRAVPHGPDRAYELARVAEETDAIAQAVHAIMVWPRNQIQALEQQKPSAGVFGHLRRIAR